MSNTQIISKYLSFVLRHDPGSIGLELDSHGLSAEEATARKVVERHGPPLVLTISGGDLHAMSHPFWRAKNVAWLTKAVTPGFISS